MHIGKREREKEKEKVVSNLAITGPCFLVSMTGPVLCTNACKHVHTKTNIQYIILAHQEELKVRRPMFC